jgi:hypothetical protein
MVPRFATSVLLIWLFENEDDDEYENDGRMSGSSSLPMAPTVKAPTMKSAAVKMIDAEAVAVEMVVSVVVVVMTAAKDKVAATVWSPTAEIRSRVRTSDIGPGEISALTSGEQ